MEWSPFSDSDVRTLRKEAYSIFKDVPRVEEPITYSDFFKNYLSPNRLCIIGKWLTQSWVSKQKWVTEDGNIDMNYLIEQFGEASCPVANCKKEEHGSHVKQEMKLSEFIGYMKQYKTSNYSDKMECLYLKDWHCVRSFPNYHFYTTPIYFASDWLNEFWDERSDNVCDDYRFVYIGPKGSWTPFHCDVLRSYSWSANICGRKKWIFLAPGEEENLKDTCNNLPYDLRSVLGPVDIKQYPNIKKVNKFIEVIQEEGEVVFVPSGWHHQVFNLEDTISINHNWMNGCNIDLCWEFLVKSLLEVQQEIEDCREMEGWDKQCQTILKCTSGIDYIEFYNFLKLIANNRIKALLDSQKENSKEYVHDRPSHDGPSHDRPSHDRPSHDGPSHDGPSHDGPSHGPSHDGPSHDGPSHDGPSHDGPSHVLLKDMKTVDAGQLLHDVKHLDTKHTSTQSMPSNQSETKTCKQEEFSKTMKVLSTEESDPSVIGCSHTSSDFSEKNEKIKENDKENKKIDIYSIVKLGNHEVENDAQNKENNPSSVAHFLFDLRRVQCVLQSMLCNEDMKCVLAADCDEKTLDASDFLQQLNDILNTYS